MLDKRVAPLATIAMPAHTIACTQLTVGLYRMFIPSCQPLKLGYGVGVEETTRSAERSANVPRAQIESNAALYAVSSPSTVARKI